MSENWEIYTAGKNFTLPPALTAWTNSTSECDRKRKKCYTSPSSFCLSSLAFGLNLWFCHTSTSCPKSILWFSFWQYFILINLLKDGLLFHFDSEMSYRVIIHDPKWVFWWCWKRWHVSVVWVVNQAYMSTNVFNIALIYNHHRQALVEI